VYECDRETSITRTPWHTGGGRGGGCAMVNKVSTFVELVYTRCTKGLTNGVHCTYFFVIAFKHFNAELNPVCHLLALLAAHHILHVSRIRVNSVCWKCALTACLMNRFVGGVRFTVNGTTKKKLSWYALFSGFHDVPLSLW
jgi:hypothetical protein